MAKEINQLPTADSIQLPDWMATKRDGSISATKVTIEDIVDFIARYLIPYATGISVGVKGVIPSTSYNPGTPTQNEFWFASPGTYTNFKDSTNTAITVPAADGSNHPVILAILSFDTVSGYWTKAQYTYNDALDVGNLNAVYKAVFDPAVPAFKFNTDVTTTFNNFLSPATNIVIQKWSVAPVDTSVQKLICNLNTAGSVILTQYRLVGANYNEVARRTITGGLVGMNTFSITGMAVLAGDIFGCSGAIRNVTAVTTPYIAMNASGTSFTKSSYDAAPAGVQWLYQVVLNPTTGGILAQMATIPIGADFITLPDIKTKPGRNLYNKAADLLNFGINNTGNIQNIAGWNSTKIPVLPGAKYTYIHNNGVYTSANVGAVAFLKSDGTTISTVDGNTLPNGDNGLGKVLTTPALTAFVFMNTLVGANDYAATMQFELGTVSTAYRAYNLHVDSVRDIPIQPETALKYINEDFAFLGDSITQLSGSQWFKNFIQTYTMKSWQNYAVQGCTWAHTAATAYSIVNDGGANQDNNVIANQANKLIAAVTAGAIQPTVIVILAGTNDAGKNNGVPATVFNFTIDYSALAMNDVLLRNTSGAIRYTIELLLRTYPNVRIILATPLLRGLVDNSQTVAVRSVIIQSCELMSIPYIDQTYKSGIYPLYEIGTNHKFLVDGIHPNAAGGVVVAKPIGSFLYNLLS